LTTRLHCSSVRKKCLVNFKKRFLVVDKQVQ
jgi:hypothetical protein